MSDTESTNESAVETAKRRFPPIAGRERLADPRGAFDVMDGIRKLAATLDENIPGGRDKSLALTALEDVHLRAVRALCADQNLYPDHYNARSEA